jgi:hypothetical protein
MAGNQNSGGMRPTAPQNNPANVNALGGNGQSGQPNPNYSGFAYGQNQEINNQAASAPMAAAAPTPTASANPMGAMMSGITPLDAPTTNDRPISDGVDFGRGRGSEALPGRVTNPINQNENVDLIKKYLPDLLNATRMPDAPDSYKRFVNYLKEQIL